MGLLETEEDLTDLYKPQLNRFRLVALNGLLNDKLDLNERELGNHAKDLTEFRFLAKKVSRIICNILHLCSDSKQGN